jgi:Flp pilus assembly protein TadB
VSSAETPGRAAHAANIDPALAAADTPAEERAATQSLGDIVGDLTRDFSTLMRDELALAKAEATEQAKRAGKGAGMLGGAGYAGHLVILFLSLALMFALGDWLDHLGWGAVIVALIWGIVALVLYLQGRKALKQVEPMPETVDSVKHIPDALHTNEEHR